MADEQVEQIEAPEAAPGPLATRDWFLQHLISLTNATTDGTFPVTLSVNGMLVAGTLVSIHQYFREVAGPITGSVFSNEESAPAKAFHQDIAEMGPDPTTKPSAIPFTDLNYVHLKGAKFFTAGGQTMNVTSSVLWRGRLTEVTGWSFGKFEPA